MNGNYIQVISEFQKCLSSNIRLHLVVKLCQQVNLQFISDTQCEPSGWRQSEHYIGAQSGLSALVRILALPLTTRYLSLGKTLNLSLGFLIYKMGNHSPYLIGYVPIKREKRI